MQFYIASDVQFQIIRKRIDDRDSDAVQAAGDFVGAVVEFAAGVQHRHDDFGRGAAFFGVDVHRDAAPVIRHRHRFIGVNRDHHAIAMTGQCLIDCVINYLEHHVVKTAAVVGVADVHSGTLSNRVEPL